MYLSTVPVEAREGIRTLELEPSDMVLGMEGATEEQPVCLALQLVLNSVFFPPS